MEQKTGTLKKIFISGAAISYTILGKPLNLRFGFTGYKAVRKITYLKGCKAGFLKVWEHLESPCGISAQVQNTTVVVALVP